MTIGMPEPPKYCGPSMMPIVNVVYAVRLRVTRVVQAPVNINGQYDFGDLESNIQTLIDEVGKRKKSHASIARRAYELYEIGGDGKAKTCRTGCERSKSFGKSRYENRCLADAGTKEPHESRIFASRRLKQLRLSPRDRARATNMAESHVAQHQTPSNRTHTDDQLERVPKLPPGQFAKFAYAECREHPTKRLDQPLLHRRPGTPASQAAADQNDI